MNQEKKQKIIQAGKIAAEIKKFIKPQIKPQIPLLEIAEKIESKIFELGGKPAFPVNLSINQVAAHYTPIHNDKTLASGLLKVDFGVHIDGYLSDTAFSIDLENSEENKNLIRASQDALKSAQEKIKSNISISEISAEIQKTIESQNFSPIINLTGHSMNHYDLHSGISIPNFDNKQKTKLNSGLYAIEPFTTLKNATGKVKEGGPSGIYILSEEKNTRSPLSREVLKFIKQEYSTLPFCSRWLVKKFSSKVILALSELERSKAIYQFPQLIEASNAKVSQAENTILLDENETIVTTE